MAAVTVQLAGKEEESPKVPPLPLGAPTGELRLQLQDTCGSHDSGVAADPLIKERQNATGVLRRGRDCVCPLSMGAESRGRQERQGSVSQRPVGRGAASAGCKETKGCVYTSPCICVMHASGMRRSKANLACGSPELPFPPFEAGSLLS